MKSHEPIELMSDNDRKILIVLYALVVAEERGLIANLPMELEPKGLRAAKLLLGDGWRPNYDEVCRILVSIWKCYGWTFTADGLGKFAELVCKILGSKC